LRADEATSDRGSLTLFTAVLALGLMVMAGLVIDGTGKLRAARRADGIAEEAARAGADSLNAIAVRSGQPAVVDERAAINAATDYLTTAGVRGTVTAVGPNEIVVTVTVRQPTAILGLVGIQSWTVTGHAIADLEQGA
jgi:Flp pilus assembly protein TadG